MSSLYRVWLAGIGFWEADGGTFEILQKFPYSWILVHLDWYRSPILWRMPHGVNINFKMAVFLSNWCRYSMPKAGLFMVYSITGLPHRIAIV